MPYKSKIVTSSAAAYQKPRIQQAHLYKGVSTLDESNSSSKLFDLDLIKRDILNHFNTRKGSRLMRPNFGSMIWDLLMTPLTPSTKDQLVADVNAVCTFDPRVVPTQIDITEYENGFILELTLLLKETNESSTMRLAFDQSLGLVQQ
jgi:phage baseplate assembly protein W